MILVENKTPEQRKVFDIELGAAPPEARVPGQPRLAPGVREAMEAMKLIKESR